MFYFHNQNIGIGYLLNKYLLRAEYIGQEIDQHWGCSPSSCPKENLHSSFCKEHSNKQANIQLWLGGDQYYSLGTGRVKENGVVEWRKL
jgi:hypothetical protein